MSAPDQFEIAGAAPFRGEPGEHSPDAVAGWSADDARGYREWQLQQTVRDFASLYGWDEAERAIWAAAIVDPEEDAA